MLGKIGNEYLHLTFDNEINNVVEIRNKSTGDNYIKTVPLNSILSFCCIKNGSRKKEKFIPAKVDTLTRTCGQEIEKLEIGYSRFKGSEVDLNLDLSIDAKVTVEIKKGEHEIKWKIELKNNDTEYDVVETLFPHITGMFLGKSWEDDTVIYPHHAGEKTLNPVKEYTTEKYMNFWRASTKVEDGVYYREINYCGLASMMWMYYYDKCNGFYISSYDKDFLLTGLRVETGGPQNPWMGFGIRKYIRIKHSESWTSSPYSIAVNCKDWHWGAKTYRKWIEKYIEIDNNPSYLKDEYVLNQCYNFKQGGKIRNKFDKIPELFETGKEYNMRHMFIASWNRRGFDCNYPEYYPDMELGTSMDLHDGCRYVNEKGGFVTFYINARIFDIESDFFSTLGKLMAIKKENGDMIYEKYGPVKFAVMCPSDKNWQKHIIDTACWMVKSYGATGIYLDQLGSAEPFPCYDEGHIHENIGDFNKGYLYIVKNLKEKLNKLNPGTFLMIENCGDVYGSYVWGNLTWNGDPYDEYFNVYKYTFPEYVQVNMVNPPKNTKTREERFEGFYKYMQRALLLGSVMWLGATYKFKDGDEEIRLFAKKAINFRGKLNPLISNGRYIDDEGILYASQGINVSRWIINDGSDLLIVGNIDELSESYLLMKLSDRPKNVMGEDIDGNRNDIKYSFQDNRLKVYVTEKKISYILIRRDDV